MDRLRANTSIRSGLWLAAFAVFMFAFTFFFAVYYIGS